MKSILNFSGYVLAGIIGALFVTVFQNKLKQPETVISTSFEAPVKNESFGKTVKMEQASAAAPSKFPTSFNSAARKATSSVVKIKTLAAAQQPASNPFRFFFGDDNMFGPQMGAGSGVIITSDGYIVTNNHVIDGASDIEVTLNDGRTYKAVKVGYDRRTDLAVVKIEAFDLQEIEYANSDEVQIGDWVLAIGNPFEYLTSTVTAGIVSAKGRDIDILRSTENIESFIQTDAAVNPGNSGGALVNLEGELVGINTAIATQTGTFSGYSFAIPVNLMKKIAEDIIQYGTYKRAMLGVGIQPIDNDVANAYGIDVQPGVLVNSVSPGGAAELAGLLPRDIITGVNGKKIKNVPEIQEYIGGKQVGDVVDLQIIREGEQKNIPVRLKEG